MLLSGTNTGRAGGKATLLTKCRSTKRCHILQTCGETRCHGVICHKHASSDGRRGQRRHVVTKRRQSECPRGRRGRRCHVVTNIDNPSAPGVVAAEGATLLPQRRQPECSRCRRGRRCHVVTKRRQSECSRCRRGRRCHVVTKRRQSECSRCRRGRRCHVVTTT